MYATPSYAGLAPASADAIALRHAAHPAALPAAPAVTIDKPGIYPFVSHSFASVDLGEVGLLNVGGVPGTMSH